MTDHQSHNSTVLSQKLSALDSSDIRYVKVAKIGFSPDLLTRVLEAESMFRMSCNTTHTDVWGGEGGKCDCGQQQCAEKKQHAIVPFIVPSNGLLDAYR